MQKDGRQLGERRLHIHFVQVDNDLVRQDQVWCDQVAGLLGSVFNLEVVWQHDLKDDGILVAIVMWHHPANANKFSLEEHLLESLDENIHWPVRFLVLVFSLLVSALAPIPRTLGCNLEILRSIRLSINIADVL